MIAPRVYTILLNWNNYPDSKACLESLAAATYSNHRVVVVDNASKDQSGQKLRVEYPQHKFVFNECNLGFARGCNVGIRTALSDPECRYVLLLNNDAIVQPGFLEPAVEAAEGDPSVGAVSGKVIMDDNRIWYAGGSVNRWRGGVAPRGFAEKDRGQYDKTESVRWVTGALMLLPRSVLENVGLLPEEYFFGFEEYDYSLTLLRAGYTLLYVPRCLAFHRGGGSQWSWEPKYVYNAYRNKLIMQQKFLPPGFFWLWKLSYRAYVYWYSETWRRRWAKAHAHLLSVRPPPPSEAFQFALAEAIADHGKTPLSEEALQSFHQKWQGRLSIESRSNRTPNRI